MFVHGRKSGSLSHLLRKRFGLILNQNGLNMNSHQVLPHRLTLTIQYCARNNMKNIGSQKINESDSSSQLSSNQIGKQKNVNDLEKRLQNAREHDAYTEQFMLLNEFNPQQDAAQNYIISATTIDRLIDVFDHFKDQMNLVNYGTCLHQAIKLSKDSVEDLTKLVQLAACDNNVTGSMIIEITQYLEENMAYMKGFTASNYLSNIVKLKLYTSEQVDRIATLASINDWRFSSSQTSFIIWTLASSNTSNESYLKFSVNNLMQIQSAINPFDLARIFLGLGKLKQVEDRLTEYLENQIMRSSQKFTVEQINMIFMSYEKFYRKNIDILDALAGRYMDLGKHLTFKTISNFLVSCSNMNYVNQILLEYIEKQLLRRIKLSILQENSDISDDSGQSVLSKHIDPTQNHIYSAEENSLFEQLMNLNKNDSVNSTHFSTQNNINQFTSEKNNNSQQTTNIEQFDHERLTIEGTIIEEENISNRPIKNVEYYNNIETDKINNESEEQSDNDNNCIIDVTMDEKAIQMFQKDFDNQRDLLKIQKQQNEDILNRTKVHRYDRVDSLNPTHATMILLAFSKMKVVKPELFEVLEANFSNKLEQASPKDVATYSYAHSMLCSELQQQFYDSNKQFLKRSLKNIKKYNNYFYEVVLPTVEYNINNYSCQQLQVIFSSASKPQVTKRSICKQLISVGIKSIPKLLQEPMSSVEERSLIIYKHFQLLNNFTYSEQLHRDLVQAFIDQQIPIQELHKRYQHILPNIQVGQLQVDNEHMLIDFSEN